jgi:acyl carrier protein
MEEIKDQVDGFVRSNFYVGAQPLDDETSLLDTGIIDSTGVLELLGFLEETFGIRVADEEITPENLDAIGRIAKFIERKLAVRQTA